YMIASVSHDLKTPLTSIKAYAESSQKEQLTKAEVAQYKQVIVEKSEFMQHMLDDLLTYTLLQSPSYKIERVEVDGTEFFDMLLSGYGPLVKSHHIHLQKKVLVTGNYYVNPQQMIRVVDNLMSNAVKYTPAERSIYLMAISEGELPNWLLNTIHENFTFDFNKFVY